jgi:cell division protein FtsL
LLHLYIGILTIKSNMCFLLKNRINSEQKLHNNLNMILIICIYLTHISMIYLYNRE